MNWFLEQTYLSEQSKEVTVIIRYIDECDVF